MRRFLALSGCAVAIAVLGLQARQAPAAPQATFRAGVDLVDIDVSVLDAHRLPVKGLTAADFTVLEDGAPRPVVAFTAVDLPPRALPRARWMTSVAPDVRTNDLAHEGRLVVILIDRLAPELVPAAQRFAQAAVDQLRPGDLAAVAYSTFGVPQNFTADRARLLAAIHQPRVGLPADDGGGEAMCRCGACTLDSIARIAEALEPVHQRRKMLFLIGNRVAIQSSGPCGGILQDVRERATRALETSNTTVHVFDPTGLETLSTGASSARWRGRAFAASLRRHGDLAVLPDRTGGRLVLDPVRPDDRMAEVFRESESYYVLGVPPAYTARDGSFHRIRVEVGRRNVTLQARRGYYAPGGAPRRPPRMRDDVPAALGSAIAGLWPRTDVALALSAEPVAVPDLSGATVAMVLSVREAPNPSQAGLFTPPATTAPALVRVLAGAFDRNGESLGYERQTLSVTPHRADGQAFEFEVLSTLPLKPGRYELRAAVEDSRLGRAGSVYTYVDVPDFRRAPLTMSGLFLEAMPARISVPSAAFSGLLPVQPTARRVFDHGDRVTGFVRIYQGVSRAAMPGYVAARIVDDADHVVFQQESRIVPAQFGATRAMDLSLEVPVARLSPGPYLLTVEARHGNETARRDVRFEVRP